MVQVTVNANSVVCSSFTCMLVRVGYEGELRYRFLLVFSIGFQFWFGQFSVFKFHFQRLNLVFYGLCFMFAGVL